MEQRKPAFYSSMAMSIENRQRTREYYEQAIPSWTQAGLLTPDEAMSLMELLNVYYPV